MNRVQPAPGKPPWVLEERPERGWETQRRGKLCTGARGEAAFERVKTHVVHLASPGEAQTICSTETHMI